MKMLQILLKSKLSPHAKQSAAEATALEFELKKRLVLLFSSARGAKPNASRLKNLALVKESVGERAIKALADEISKRKNYERLHLLRDGKEAKFSSSGEIAKSFLKAAAWVSGDGNLRARSSAETPKAPSPQKLGRQLKAQLERLAADKNGGLIDLKSYILRKRELEARIKELGG